MLEQAKTHHQRHAGVKDMERQIRAWAAKVDDPQALVQLLAVQDTLEAEIGKAARRLRRQDKVSWPELGEATGEAHTTVMRRWSAPDEQVDAEIEEWEVGQKRRQFYAELREARKPTRKA